MPHNQETSVASLRGLIGGEEISDRIQRKTVIGIARIRILVIGMGLTPLGLAVAAGFGVGWIAFAFLPVIAGAALLLTEHLAANPLIAPVGR